MTTTAAVARPLRSMLALALALGPTACLIHLGDDDGVCVGDGTANVPVSTLLLDPEDLVCKEAGFTPCDGCGPCPGTEPPVAPPTWAPCQSQCTGLDANTCATTAGCRQAWDHVCLLTDALCTLPDPYYGCFAVDTTGPIQGACDGLGALECSRHDDCLATYRRDERCSNGTDDDGDSAIDEPDECLQFGLCIAEFRR